MVKLLASVIVGSQHLEEGKVKLFDFQISRGLLKWMVKLLDHSQTIRRVESNGLASRRGLCQNWMGIMKLLDLISR